MTNIMRTMHISMTMIMPTLMPTMPLAMPIMMTIMIIVCSRVILNDVQMVLYDVRMCVI